MGMILLLFASIFPVFALSSDAPMIVVAGAGPASLMFTLRYLQLNPEARIEIYERRPRPARFKEAQSSECVAGDNAFGFGIGNRPQHTLKKIPGLFEAVAAVGHPIKLGDGRGPTTWMVNRRDLCAECIHILEKEFCINGKGRLKIHFNCMLSDIQPSNDDGNCCVFVEDFASSQDGGRWVPFSLLVGGDGVNSSVRTSLLDKGLISGQRYSSGSTWKALQIPSQPELGEVGRALSYKNKEDVGRLLPRYKGRFVLLNFRKQKAINQNPFGASNPEELKTSIRAAMPNVTEFPSEEIIQSFLDQPAGDTSYMILNKHYVPEVKTVLIGDAAVGMYSLLGQGCAYAMESAARLAEELAYNTDEGDIDCSIQNCCETNQQEGKALSDLNLISHIRSRPLVKAAFFLAMSTVMKGLSDPSDPYSDIARRSRWAILVSKPFWWLDRTRQPL